MNEQQFKERAHANPHDDSIDFLEAVASEPGRQQLIDSLKAQDAALKSGLESVSAPTHLKLALLDIPQSDTTTEAVETRCPAANDSFWRRGFQYAAGLFVAVGAATLVLQGQANPMEDMVFNHIYSELSFLEDDSVLTLDDVNEVMNFRIGGSFDDSEEMQNLEIHVTQDCWVDIEDGIQGVHIVMQGSVGPVTVMVIPSAQAGEEQAISNGRFSGVISPTPVGYLVVVGEKDEQITEYTDLLASNMNW